LYQKQNKIEKNVEEIFNEKAGKSGKKVSK
jgi:hypothetical protein